MSLDFFDSWRGVENIIQPFLRTQTAGRTKPQRVLYFFGSGEWTLGGATFEHSAL